KLTALPKVKDVSVTEEIISVHTSILNCPDTRTNLMHEIGAFRIDIYIGTGDVRWHNTTRRVHGFKDRQMAPHIWEDGRACLGNMQEPFAQLIARHEYSALAM